MDDPSEPYGEHRQQNVYASGMLADQSPEGPVRYADLEQQALEAMSDEAAAYVAGGAGTEDTVSENRHAFADWRIVPQMLRDVSERDLRVDLFDREFDLPVMLAPLGVLSIVHDEGELAVARAAADLDVPMCLSSASSYTLEAVADELGGAPKWFQLYWSADPAIASSFVERAENAGYDGIVVTLDTPLLGWRERDIEQGYLPFLDGEGVANYFSDPAFRDRLDQAPEDNEGAAVMEFVDVFGDPSLTWDDWPTSARRRISRWLSKECSTPTTRGAPSSAVRMAWSSRTTAVARSTARSARSRRSPVSWTRSTCPCCSTAGSAAAQTSSRPSRSVPTVLYSAVPTPTGWRSTVRMV